MTGDGIAIASPQNSAILLANTEASVFRIPTSFPPKFVSPKPHVTVVAPADVGQAVDNRGVTQQASVSCCSVTHFTLVVLVFRLFD